jgi:hypothetical protein
VLDESVPGVAGVVGDTATRTLSAVAADPVAAPDSSPSTGMSPPT